MKLTKWEPFADSDSFFRQFASPVFGRWPAPSFETSPVTEWAPVADIAETDKEYVVRAEVPGVKPGDIKVTLDKGVLTIAGERKYDKEDKNEQRHRVERFYGSFCRRFVLPEDADPAGIRAEGKDGLLKVHVPKVAVAAATPRQIAVE